MRRVLSLLVLLAMLVIPAVEATAGFGPFEPPSLKKLTKPPLSPRAKKVAQAQAKGGPAGGILGRHK